MYTSVLTYNKCYNSVLMYTSVLTYNKCYNL